MVCVWGCLSLNHREERPLGRCSGEQDFTMEVIWSLSGMRLNERVGFTNEVVLLQKRHEALLACNGWYWCLPIYFFLSFFQVYPAKTTHVAPKQSQRGAITFHWWKNPFNAIKHHICDIYNSAQKANNYCNGKWMVNSAAVCIDFTISASEWHKWKLRANWLSNELIRHLSDEK